MTPNRLPIQMPIKWLHALALAATVLLVSMPAWALDIYLNGAKVTNLKNADLMNCTVKFDSNGDIQILSPGYRIEYGADGQPKVVGQSDLSSAKVPTLKPKYRYVLVYEPNPKVNFAFEVWVNGKPFRKIGLDSARFTVEMTQELAPGANALRVVAKPGDAIPGGEESDAAGLRIFRGEAGPDGSFHAKSPAVWDLVRTAIDRQGVDRSYNLAIE